MKRFLILTILIWAVVNHSKAQQFSFKKAAYTISDKSGAEITEIEGEVFVSDSLITIGIKEIKVEYPVLLLYSTNDFKGFKSKWKIPDMDFRFTLSKNLDPISKEKYFLTIEAKDDFSQQIKTQIYFLIPKE